MPRPPRSDAPHAPGVLRTARHVAGKELSSSLRDPQTVVYVVLLPLLLYPALFWVMIQVASVLEARRMTRVVSVAVAVEPGVDVGRAEELAAALDTADDAQRTSAGYSARPEPATAAQLVEALRPANEAGERFDAVLLVRAGGEDAPLLLLHESARPDSVLAVKRVEERLASLGRIARRESLGDAGSDLAPLVVRSANLATERQTGAYVISMLMPMLVVLMAVFGAFYPAVDVTAGERERRSEETTLLAPAPRTGIWFGKVLAVSGLSLLATALNLAGIAFAANHLLAMVKADDVQVALSLRDLVLAAPLALALVLFTSAVLTGLASLTRTFKQGQALLGGVQLAFLAPAVVATLPALSATAGLAATPVVGVALALRAVLRGGEVDGGYAIALSAHLVYAVVAVALAVKLLGVELDTQDTTKPMARLFAAFRRSSA